MSSESRLKLGYIYTPPSSSNNYISDITEWVCHPLFNFDDVKTSFFKVAYVMEDTTQTSGVETGVFRPVYVNTDELAMLPTGFIVPEGWTKVCVYSDEENVPLPALQKVAKLNNATIPLSYGADFADDEFMSAISSLSEGIWMENDTSAFGAPSPAHITSPDFGQLSLAPETLPASQLPAVALPTYGGTTLLLTSFIPPPISIITPNIVEGHYVLCDPQQFHVGIKYTQEYLESYFVAAWVCLQDARIWGKHYLNMFGFETTNTYKARCLRALRESISIATACGQAPEKGLQCSQTGEQQDLNIVDEALGLVTSERSAFIKSLKISSAAYIDKSDRASIGGYDLGSKHRLTIPTYINSLTGLTSHRSPAPSIDFTRDEQGRPYHRSTILILLAQRLLRPVHNSSEDSLVDLFTSDYKEIPVHLLSAVCAMYVVMFRRRLSVTKPGNVRIVDVRDEAVHQLELLTSAREGHDDEAVQLNHWITTRDGEGGWLADLQNALALANGLRGPHH